MSGARAARDLEKVLVERAAKIAQYIVDSEVMEGVDLPEVTCKVMVRGERLEVKVTCGATKTSWATMLPDDDGDFPATLKDFDEAVALCMSEVVTAFTTLPEDRVWQ